MSSRSRSSRHSRRGLSRCDAPSSKTTCSTPLPPAVTEATYACQAQRSLLAGSFASSASTGRQSRGIPGVAPGVARDRRNHVCRTNNRQFHAVSAWSLAAECARQNRTPLLRAVFLARGRHRGRHRASERGGYTKASRTGRRASRVLSADRPAISGLALADRAVWSLEVASASVERSGATQYLGRPGRIAPRSRRGPYGGHDRRV